MAGGADKARLCVDLGFFFSIVCLCALFGENISVSRGICSSLFAIWLDHLVRTTRHEHAMSDSSGKASSCCFVAACNRKFIQDLFLELEDALS